MLIATGTLTRQSLAGQVAIVTGAVRDLPISGSPASGSIDAL